jgi:glycosyltransferase involved in cell wall biosynthesis
MSLKVSAIVPVLVQEPQLRDTLRNLAALRDRIDLELVLVVDVPDSARETEAHAANDPVAAEMEAVSVYRVGERGFGSALRRGFAEATGDVLIPIMADASDRPDDVVRLAEEIERGWDVVAGSRYMRGGAIVGNTAKQRLSRLYSTLLRLAGGPKIRDISNAFKAYHRSVVDTVRTEAGSFDISVELTLRAHLAGFRVGEVPTVWTNRKLGSSNFNVGRELRNYGRWLALAARARLGGAPRPAQTARPRGTP